MTSSISFKGTYVVDNQNPRSFAKFSSFALDKEKEYGVKTILKDKVTSNGKFGNINYKAKQILIVPDRMDTDVETFCANKGISYKKLSTKDLLNPDLIAGRIKNPPEGYKRVDVDSEKLKKLIKNQANNLDHCKKDYNKYYKDATDTMLKKGDAITASTFRIYSTSGNEDLKRFVERYGAKNLNDNQIIVDFNQKTDEPDHCMYFALKDLGMKKIPVYVDERTYEAGKILELFWNNSL